MEDGPLFLMGIYYFTLLKKHGNILTIDSMTLSRDVHFNSIYSIKSRYSLKD